MESTPTSRMHGSQRRTVGGGREVTAAVQQARTPPQASIAFSEIILGDAGAELPSSAGAGLSADVAATVAQHEGASEADEQQHTAAGASGAVAATRP
jgi:hypothetical protein